MLNVFSLPVNACLPYFSSMPRDRDANAATACLLLKRRRPSAAPNISLDENFGH